MFFFFNYLDFKCIYYLGSFLCYINSYKKCSILFFCQNEFQECLLYGTLEPYNKSTFKLSPGTKTNCDFPLYFGVFVCIFYAFGMGISNLYVIYKSQKDPSIT